LSSQPNEDRFLAGFILNKLYTERRFARKSTGQHRGHIRLTSLRTSLPPGHGDVERIARRMNKRLVLIFKNEGTDQICAYIDKDAVEEGLPLCNYYRTSPEVKLPPLDKTFKEMLEHAPVEEEKKEEPRKLTEKEKRNKAYLERTKKIMNELGLSSQS
jgi:hypothetical protein